ncbi:hypothetical protein [Nitrosococcus watsonii]|uniref:hypothetical protein n=1 Tax=Nitrosococcus watsonii TaxID=473531 RepID=UPI0018DF16BE|nr:hypothetical protein [Nitrosococcus watsonii]
MRRPVCAGSGPEPFNGRVQERWVEVGEYVEEGTHLARLFAVDRAEVRLPLTPAKLVFPDLAVVPRQNLGVKGLR